jgi:hypothetical protein
MKEHHEIGISRSQLYYLKLRYGKRKQGKKLIELAVLEAVKNQAKEEVDKINKEMKG